MNEDPHMKEYYEIFKTINELDKNLLIVKGWGVTLALAALAWGFKDGHYGIFLVATLAGLSFWLLEGTMKRHQMRYYQRMREIEVLRYDQADGEEGKEISSPRIDSSWSNTGALYAGKGVAEYRPEICDGPRRSYQLAWLFPHVAFPHVVSTVAGIVFFLLGFFGKLGTIKW